MQNLVHKWRGNVRHFIFAPPSHQWRCGAKSGPSAQHWMQDQFIHLFSYPSYEKTVSLEANWSNTLF